MAQATETSRDKIDILHFVKANIRDYALLISLLIIMAYFQYSTNGTLFMPVNMTNIILQNSYIVIMALGMLLIIVAAISTFGRLGLRLHRGGGGRVHGAVEDGHRVVGHPLPRSGRCDRCTAGLFRGLLPDPGLHRDPRRHARVQGARADRSRRRVCRSLPKEFQLLSSGYVPDFTTFSSSVSPLTCLPC